MILIAEALLLERIALSRSPPAAHRIGAGSPPGLAVTGKAGLVVLNHRVAGRPAADIQRQDTAMTAPRDRYYPGEDGQGRYPALEAMDRDLERLGELTRAYVTDEKEDLGVAAARIPDKDLRREAEELLSRLKDAIGPDPESPDAISETLAEPGTGPHPA